MTAPGATQVRSFGLNGGDLGDHLLNAITDLRERSAPIAQRLLADRAEGANS